MSGIAGDGSVYTCKHLLHIRNASDCVFCHRDQLRNELSLAEEGLANYQQDLERARNELHYIRNAQAEWLMTCKCECPACMALLESFRDAVPQDGNQT